ncbi:MAG: putative Ig domain-containing protein, partial [Ekhidna sp.]|nr:putative Ig domain-containing protein [Ekhidna sp.]
TLASVTITSATLTITDDDATPTAIALTLDADTISEGDGATDVEVTATVGGTTRWGTAQTVRITVAGSGSDNVVGFTDVSPFNLTIPAGEATATAAFTLTPSNNIINDNNETVTVSGTLASVTITSATLTITDDDTPAPPPNAAPTVMNGIPDQTATVGTILRYTFPVSTFSDVDGDALTYTAARGNGLALPDWLTFNANSRTFSGTPQAADAGTLTVKVTASDGNGGLVSDSFDITIRDKAPLGAADAAKVVIFPNPSGCCLEVRSVAEGTFKIVSLSGRPLLKGATNIKVDITSLKSGLYLVQLPDGRLLKFVRK